MIELHLHKLKDKIPDADYVLEKTDKLFDIISFLTPKFSGKWKIILIDPKLKFIKELLRNESIPEWLDVSIYIGQKKLNSIVLDFPNYQPKAKTRKEEFDEIIKNLNHVIDESAKRLLFKALGSSLDELRDVVDKLDKECKQETITLKQVRNSVNFVKRVYASDVVNAFLIGDARRWNLYNALVKELGMEISYYAIYKYVKTLLKEKGEYLQNKDVKQYIIKKIDAPLICYTYVLFANSNNHNQLYGLMYAIEHRSKESMERIQYVNLQ